MCSVDGPDHKTAFISLSTLTVCDYLVRMRKFGLMPSVMMVNEVWYSIIGYLAYIIFFEGLKQSQYSCPPAVINRTAFINITVGWKAEAGKIDFSLMSFTPLELRNQALPGFSVTRESKKTTLCIFENVHFSIRSLAQLQYNQSISFRVKPPCISSHTKVYIEN